MSHTERFNERSEVKVNPRQWNISSAQQPRREFYISVLFNPAGRAAARSLSLSHDTEAAPTLVSRPTKRKLRTCGDYGFNPLSSEERLLLQWLPRMFLMFV